MKMMAPTRLHWEILYLVMLVSLFFVKGDEVPVRFGEDSPNYPHSVEGRVEVYHNNEWGQICTDDWDDNDCKVVCRQQGLTAGTAVKGSLLYGPGTGNIWLSQVQCTGNEKHIGECMRNNWGTHFCDDVTHMEDAGCQCLPDDGSGGGDGSSDQSSSGVPGVCNPSRHRITYFNSLYKGIGRAEIKDQSGNWRSICDDHWDDVDAAVFCSCMSGFSQSHYYRAYWSSNLASLAPSSIIYDAVNCKTTDMNKYINIWDCETTPAEGSCSAVTEAATVACEAVPQVQPPNPPTVSLTCDGKHFEVCFTSDDYQLSGDHMALDPVCEHAVVSKKGNGVCVDISMEDCISPSIASDPDHKHYCYNVTYTQYDTNPNTLLLDDVWSRKTCCSVEKNGTVTSAFQPIVLAHEEVRTDAPTQFTIKCFEDETFSNALMFPAVVSKGQDVFCRVTAHTWDPKLYLVVPNCRFTPSTDSPNYFQFLVNKCPISKDLGISYFSLDEHNWGFKFMMPKFQGYEMLWLTCDSYVCDDVLDDKPYCDRSCNPSSRRKRSVAKEEDSDVNGQNEFVSIQEGPFIIHDTVTNQTLSIVEKTKLHVGVHPQQPLSTGDLSTNQTERGTLQKKLQTTQKTSKGLEQSSKDVDSKAKGERATVLRQKGIKLQQKNGYVKIPPALGLQTNTSDDHKNILQKLTDQNETAADNSTSESASTMGASSADDMSISCILHLVMAVVILRWILAGCPPLIDV